ncbi:hydroxyphenylacetyl-CoA thioesterase PaaI [Hoeflea alexandrii]|uniref:Hydroxyphenylacetyl-CoA thioesterase PaaI n=1 Tax=Hoeflea alexandrii TaxID=288436 RepID=A0ABT1CPW7_9HYPH|nr:hydroxyphenylacetyl-CoA thioesterase PaaI [Hoeflea alexandrii]MCO6407656.1 hydroxyphenylacetyl-CoA thioesterase PaaI [Hoeflea alexandrii]MCY0153965.1 hydroxyphenylacetyl-CoA thioesterase PaaI [Hoeflea alexandrii]
MSPISDQERAERSSEAMLRDDHTTKGMGMNIDAVGPGRATLSMVVRKDHLNGHGSCHGGAIFTLADSAFAFACNSHNTITVAQHCSVTFLAPGREGDRLTATAREVTLAGRSGVYDVSVTRQDGVTIAEFRGLSRTVSGTHFEEPAA